MCTRNAVRMIPCADTLKLTLTCLEQIIQLGMSGMGQTIPVQVPVSGSNGQNVFQTIPIQLPFMQNVMQAAGQGQGIQVIPQIAQV